MIYDAVLVPGGGIRGTGLPPWVENRFDAAVRHAAPYYIALSGGTPHRKSPRDENGWTLYESVLGAAYLSRLGIAGERIRYEIASWDTIGNAYFSRVLFGDALRLRRVLIVTSHFHMARTQAVFRWIWGLDGHFDLSFESVPDVGMPPDALATRLAKEQSGLAGVERLSEKIRSYTDLHEWIYTAHSAYAIQGRESAYREKDDLLLGTY